MINSIQEQTLLGNKSWVLTEDTNNLSYSETPTLYMLVGIPGSGKSTFADETLNPFQNIFVYSTDDEIEAEAEEQGKTYNEVFSAYFKKAKKVMDARLSRELYQKQGIIWDQTNVTVKSRKGKLSQIPADYKKIAVFLNTPISVALRRNSERDEGRQLPESVIINMQTNLEAPTVEEGFDQVWTIETTKGGN